jgi:CBS domain-containing protein
MTRDVATVTPRMPLTRLLQRMLDTRNKSFPVVDGARLVGVVAREDVLQALRRAAAGEKATGAI